MIVAQSIPYKGFKERIRVVESIRKQFKKIRKLEINDEKEYVYVEVIQTNKGSLLGL